MTNEELFLIGDFDTLYTRNERFLHYTCKKFTNLGFEYEDLVGCANLAFAKSIRTFNPSVSKWLTYFSKLITNEILILNRKNKKHLGVLHLEDIIATDTEGHTLCIGDIVSDDMQLQDEVLDGIILQEMRESMKGLKEREKLIMELHLQGNTQSAIAQRIGISQSYVGRLIALSRTKLKRMYEKGA